MREIKLHTDLKPCLERHENKNVFLIDHWVFRFKDDKGAIVASYRYKNSEMFISRGSPLTPFEITPIQFYENSDDFKLMEKPLGFLTEDEVNDLLNKLKGE